MSELRADVANALYWDLAIPRYGVTAEVGHGLVPPCRGWSNRLIKGPARRRSCVGYPS
jgi:hypothetical protein